MKQLKKSLSVLIALSMTALPIAETQGSAATGGATEVTQIVSWLANELSWVEQLIEMGNQLTELKKSFNVQDLMNKVLPGVSGLVRDATDMRNTLAEVASMKDDIQSAMGALQDLRSFSDARFKEMSNYNDQFGSRKTAQDFFLQQMRSNASQHKMNNIMRDQEVAALTRLKATTDAIKKHADSIPTTSGVHQAVSLLSTQMNTMVAMTADANKVILTRSMRDTQKDDEAAAQAKLSAYADDSRRAATEIFFRRNSQALGR